MVLDTSYFDIYNVVLMGLALLILFFAYRKGFVCQLLDVLTYFGSFILAILLSPIMAQRFPLLGHISHSEILAVLDALAMHIANVGVWFFVVICGIAHRISDSGYLVSQKEKDETFAHQSYVGAGLRRHQSLFVGDDLISCFTVSFDSIWRCICGTFCFIVYTADDGAFIHVLGRMRTCEMI